MSTWRWNIRLKNKKASPHSYFPIRQEKRKMLGLDVAALCLLFGAVAHSQLTPCMGGCSEAESLQFHSHNVFRWCVKWARLCVCVCLLSPVRDECPIDVYFTIDTSESIALQEPPPGSLVESIKVPWLCYSKNLKTMWPHSAVLLLLNDTQSCCMMCYRISQGSLWRV